MFGFMQKQPFVVFAAFPVIVLLMIVCRIGIYKYATANRHLGYELHLARLASRGVKYSELDWEEAVRAWRIVHPAIFRAVYRVPQVDLRLFGKAILGVFVPLQWVNDLRPDLYIIRQSVRRRRDEFRPSNDNDKRERGYPWFLPAELTKPANKEGRAKGELPCYHAGTYLQSVLGILVLMQYALLVPLAAALLEDGGASGAELDGMAHSVGCVALLLAVVVVALRDIRMRRRREILESELLSIHSCAVVWNVVVLAHEEATRDGFAGYTEKLATIAREVAKVDELFKIHSWIETQERRLKRG